MMGRVGFGYDIHRLVAHRDCILGGVKIPYEKGLLGHSDADVLLHAIADAILGAIGAGDIGKHFPDTKAENQHLDSSVILKKAKEIASKKGYSIGNIDSTIVAEAPKLMEFIPRIEKNIADILTVDVKQISVKATTNEGIGTIGRGDGIAAFAVACLIPS